MWMQFNTILINHNLQWNLWQRQSCTQLCMKCGGRRCLSHLLHHLLVLCCYKSCRYYIAHPFVFIFRFWKWITFAVVVFLKVFSYCLLDFARRKFKFLIFFFWFSVYDLIDVIPGCSLTRPFSSQIMILAFVGKLLNIYPKQ